MSKKNRRQNLDDDNQFADEEDPFIDVRQSRRDKRRNRRKAKNKFDNAVASGRYSHRQYENFEELDYDENSGNY